MTKNQAPQLPADELIPGTTPGPTSDGEQQTARRVPQRGVRKRVLGEGEGDYCIYEIVGAESKLPKGALIPLPNVPRFIDTAAALKWIRNESGDLLAGRQVMIFRACEILSLRVQQKPTVVIESKPKVTVTKAPETSDG